MFRVAIKSVALVLLLAGAGVGAAEAQTTIPPDARRTAQCAPGVFTLTGGTAAFHVTLDDYSSKPAVFVVMRFINPQGVVVRSRTVTLGPGGSAMLEYRGSGLYRVRADAFESSSADSSEETKLLASLYLSYDATPADGDPSSRRCPDERVDAGLRGERQRRAAGDRREERAARRSLRLVPRSIRAEAR
jgi:hypothetical protein